MRNKYNKPKQSSRIGKSAICIFVRPEKKSKIISALAASGYGTTFQEGITNLLDGLIESKERKEAVD